MPLPKSSLRAAAARQAPLFIALIVIALVIVFGRKPRPKPAVQAAEPTPQTFTPTAPEAIPEEPPFGPLSVADCGLPYDVDQVLASKCRRCHATPPRHNAPFPLFTWTDLQALRGSTPIFEYVGRVVQSGFMPLRIAANPPVEPLSDSEKKTLLDWVNAGAPRDTCKPPSASKKGRASAARPRSSP
jgi:hypothetical protein